jgi:hypothetical protein
MGLENSDLPYVDTNQTTIAASRELVWTALRRYVDSSLGVGESNPLTWVLGTEPRSGFEVTRDVPNQQLNLAGRHRFARYQLWSSTSLTSQTGRHC